MVSEIHTLTAAVVVVFFLQEMKYHNKLQQMTHFLFASIITVIMVMNVAQGLNLINFIMVHLKREFAEETERT